MRKFLTRLISLSCIAVLPNFVVGVLRLNAGDNIPYTANRRKSLITPDQQHVKTPYQLVPEYPVADMSRNPIGKGPIWRAYDLFGFSNITENKSPEILLTGDSFFNDPHTGTTDGMQAGINHRLGKNIAYNIGKSECAGFKVYNELGDIFFKKKPTLLVFEVVERNCYNTIMDAPQELRRHSIKSTPYKNMYADLVFGNNFKDLDESKLLKKETKQPQLGSSRMVDGRKVWFLNSRLTSLTDQNLNKMVDSMLVIRNLLAADHVNVVFMLAPDKESLYPSLFGVSEIKSLQTKMAARQLDYIDMYGAMDGNGARYYYDEDTHWNRLAIELICDGVVKKYKERMGLK